jgi:hypothetical protein
MTARQDLPGLGWAAVAAVVLSAAGALAGERVPRVVPLTEIHREATTPAEPCEDETGRAFRGGPTAFVDGLRPQGYCGPPGWREQARVRAGAADLGLREEALSAGCALALLPEPATAEVLRRCREAIR